MKTIAVYLDTVDGFHAVQLTPEQAGQLAGMLRTDGPTAVHTTKDSYMAEGIYIPAKGHTGTKIIMIGGGHKND